MRKMLILSGLLLRSEEHTSELQSLAYLVCRLLLEKKTIPRPVRRAPTPSYITRCVTDGRRVSAISISARGVSQRRAVRRFLALQLMFFFLKDRAPPEFHPFPPPPALRS